MANNADRDKLDGNGAEMNAATNDRRLGTLVGRNPVLEALKSGRPINKIYIQNHIFDGAIREIESLSRERGVPIIRVEKAWLDKLSRSPHQGAVASVSVKQFSDIQDMLNCATERGDKPLIVLANEIYDPRNLGAIIRSAEAAGAHGVVIPKRNSTGLTDIVAKASAGAIEYMQIARVGNIAAALTELKKQGLWVVGADSRGEIPYTECDMTGATAIVIGGEDKGLGKLVGATCDYVVSLPMRGKIRSLNASAAAAVLLYEVLRQRMRMRV